MNENELFEEWKNKIPKEESNYFIPDGIVDYEKWKVF